MAAQERRLQILQRLQNSFMQLLPIAKEYVRAEEAEVNEAERAERLRIAFRYQLARALERNRMVAFWNLPQDAPHFLPIPLENGQPLVLPAQVQFPATMIDLFSIRQLNEMQALLRAYGLPEEGRLHELKARFFTYITNGPRFD